MKHRYDIHNVPEELLQYKKEFCIDVARWLFEFSALSYHTDLNVITPQVEEIGFKVKRYINIDNSECLIVYNDDIIIVSFTGTQIDQIEDIWTDAQFWHSKAEVGKVHAGFYSAYHKLKFPVYRAILELNKEKERDIFWTGHSLGGALSVIFSTYYKSGIVYTYGQPKVGDWVFASHAEKTITLYRIVNDIDAIVPLPPSILGYQHFGTEVQYIVSPEVYSFKWLKRSILFELAKLALQLVYKYAWITSKLSYYLVKGILYHSLPAYRRLLSNDNYIMYVKMTPEELAIFYRHGPTI